MLCTTAAGKGLADQLGRGGLPTALHGLGVSGGRAGSEYRQSRASREEEGKKVFHELGGEG